MRFLRRSAPVGADSASAHGSGPSATGSGPSESDEAPTAGKSPGKGRPTPKRRDAEGRRRGPAPPPPRTQREAMRRNRANRPSKEDRRATKDERRAAAALRRERMAAGDEKFLLPRDRGPVRAYVRDLVDSRPHLMGLFMPLAIVVLVAALLQNALVAQYLSLFSLVALISMIFEGILLGVSVTRQARTRFPDETIGGLRTGWYTFTRASQLRRLRIPKPRVARGATVT